MAAMETLSPGMRAGSWHPDELEDRREQFEPFLIRASKVVFVRQHDVTLTILSKELPASSKMAQYLNRHCRVCS